MKKQLSLLTAGVLAFSASALTIVKDGKAAAALHVNAPVSENKIPLTGAAADKMPSEELALRVLRTAVEDFNYHIKKMSGAEIPVKYSTAAADNAICLEIAQGEPDEFTIKSEEKRLTISGRDGFALANGLYEVLYRLGCDWVFPGPTGEVIPKMSTVTTSSYTVKSKPDFAVRCPWYPGNVKKHSKAELENFAMWKLRNKMQLSRYNHPLVMIGGHVSDALIRRYKKRFEANPDMYALVRQIDGSFIRRGPQLETTNPKVIEMIEDYIRTMFKNNNWPKDKTVCIGVGPADGGGYSESIESQMASSGRLDPATGNKDFTDLQVLLCNTLLERLEKEFPNLHLGFYLYSNHADFPVRYKPHPKIVLVIADISYSRLHSTLEDHIKTRRYYKSLGVKGVYNETTKGTSNLAIGNYIEAKMLWDTKLKWRNVLKTFCKNAYGKAAAPMEKFYTAITLRQSKAGMEAGSFHSFRLIYDLKFVAQMRKLFDEARKLAETDVEKERIRIAELSLTTLEDHLKFKNAFNNFEFDKAKTLFEKIMSDLKWKSTNARISSPPEVTATSAASIRMLSIRRTNIHSLRTASSTRSPTCLKPCLTSSMPVTSWVTTTASSTTATSSKLPPSVPPGMRRV